ncbi:MAG: AAA family ATPase [Acidimicrobiia bacterium]|nr:AAA family ATPase [Acidimicrobiia bacterium]
MTNLLEREPAVVPAPMEGRLAIPTGPRLHPWDADAMVFMAAVLSGEHPYTGAVDAGDLPIDVSSLPDGFMIAGRYRGTLRQRVRAVSGDASVLIARDGKETSIWWSSETAERCVSIGETIRARLPEREAPLTARTWRRSPDGSAACRQQSLEAPLWADVADNYVSRTAGLLGQLMRLQGPPESGRLLLWHGPPGTGKTRALLALLHEWKAWCAGHVVADPEHLFEDPSYLLEVVHSIASRSSSGSHSSNDDPWALIIAEDADEYLRSDARQRSGPALGRLLNLTDGILGQGLRVLVVLTTNDDIGRLHPAVTRPGRCAAVVEFEAFTATEAAAWLAGRARTPQHPCTLAELYELVAGDRAPGVQGDVVVPGAYL